VKLERNCYERLKIDEEKRKNKLQKLQQEKKEKEKNELENLFKPKLVAKRPVKRAVSKELLRGSQSCRVFSPIRK